MRRISLLLLFVILMFCILGGCKDSTELNVDPEVSSFIETTGAVSSETAVPPTQETLLSPAITPTPYATQEPDTFFPPSASPDKDFDTPTSSLDYAPTVIETTGAVSPETAVPPTQETFLSPAITPTPYATQEPDTFFPPSASPDKNFDTPTSSLDYVPTVIVSNIQNNNTVIAVYDERYNEEDSTLNAFLLTCDTVYDMLISRVIENVELKYIENGGFLYVPVLSAGQAVSLFAEYESSIWRIAYTNSAGEYEAVLLHWGGDESMFTLTPTEPMLMNEFYDVGYFSNEYNYQHRYTEAFRDKVLSGVFNAYVPTGFVISGGSIGDVNNDGIEDALINIITAGYRVAAYHGIMPLLVLIGQRDGGYVVEHENPRALFTPDRSSSYPVAGTGYIDFVYRYIDSAAINNTEVYRFWYDSAKNDWLLKEFIDQPTFNADYSEMNTYNFVRALPSFLDLQLEEFDRDVYWNASIEWDYFDMVENGKFPIPYWGSRNELYTLALKVNETEGYYEGYIYKYYESIDSGSFIQTIRGEFELSTKPTITVNEEDSSFIIHNDKWKLSKLDTVTFHLDAGTAR